MQPKLIVVGGDVKTKEVTLSLPATIGRGNNVTLTLPHPLVSRQHCEIFEKDGELKVRDLGSLNGTFVNNQRIDQDFSLKPGELLTIGSVTFRAAYDSDFNIGAGQHTDLVSSRTGISKKEPYQDRNELLKKKTVADQYVDGNAIHSSQTPFVNDHLPLDYDETISFGGVPSGNQKKVR